MTDRRTLRQRNGTTAEDRAAEHLAAGGWRILARGVRVKRDEIDIVALDPGPPAAVVCVEVRSARSVDFGAPEERVDRRKVTSLYRAMAALRAGRPLTERAATAWRVDLLIVDGREGPARFRHLRGLEPPG